jgi:nucleoside 2-deoxyribosyltransferase
VTRRSIYLASPLGFATSTRGFMADLVADLREVAVIHNPWDDQRFAAEFARLATEDSVSVRDMRLAEINTELGRANAAAIDASDGLFAILDGVDVDSGTAAEIGYAAAQGKYICGLRTDFRLAGDNPGSIVNLQVQYFIEGSGGVIVTTPGDFVILARDFAARPDERTTGDRHGDTFSMGA